MAEILLSLTIIGVVAAITLPSLTGNINERTWNTQRKALYARMSQAIALMPSLNGYGTLTEGENAQDTAAETFVTEGLSKVLKINNICDADHLADCGIPAKVTGLNGSIVFSEFPKTLVDYNKSFAMSLSLDWYGGVNYNYSQTNTKTAAFETQNGESIAVFYYPRCQAKTEGTGYYVMPKMCANFVYDLNGSKGPNTVGKDIGFITALYPSDPVVVAPMPLVRSPGRATHKDASALCLAMDSDSRMASNEELMAIFYNMPLVGEGQYYDTWSNNIYSGDINLAYSIHLLIGQINRRLRTQEDPVLCIKR